MTAAPQDGLLDLTLACDAAMRTRIVDRHQRFPLSTTVPFYLDPVDEGMAFIYIQNPTGGVFSGDRLQTRVTAKPGVRAHLTTPAATKVYRMDGDGAECEFEFTLARGSHIEYLPDLVIPYGGSRMTQRMKVNISDGSTFLSSETLGPGRLARGEIFAYDRLAFRTEICRDGVPLCVDSLVLEPFRHSPQAYGAYDNWRYFGTVLVVSPEAAKGELAENIRSQLTLEDGYVCGVGTLPNEEGLIIRVLAYDGSTIRRVLTRAISIARTMILGHPLPRTRK